MKNTKQLKYLEILNLNRQMILDSKLNKNIKICYRLTNDDFLINQDNIKKINKKSIKKQENIKSIVIDCDLINVFKLNSIIETENNLKIGKIAILEKIKFHNIYLIEGNKLIQKIFNKVKIILDNYPINIAKTVFKIINYDTNINYFLNDLSNLIQAYLMTAKKDRYEFIYETVSSELERRFNAYNLCRFDNNICSNHARRKIKNAKNGCCYVKGTPCSYLKNGHCTINALACKFFSCYYLQRNGINYQTKDFLLLTNYLTRKQRKIISDTLFTDKEDIINLL